MKLFARVIASLAGVWLASLPLNALAAPDKPPAATPDKPLAAAPDQASHYPLTVTDMAGRSVTIPVEPARVALQDGRDVMMVALLDRANPVARVKVWNNILAREDANSWRLIADKWPQAKAIPDMGFGDDGQVNPEAIVAARPQLVIAQRRALGSMEQSGVIGQLAALHVPLVFIDTFDAPVPDAERSVLLLGQVLNRQAEAGDYARFYDDHLKHLQDVIAPIKQRPLVFVEALAGLHGPEQCCFTHGKVGWGLLVDAIGARNLGSTLLSKRSGEVTLETVLGAKPDVYVMSGREAAKSGNVMVPLGYDADQGKVDAAMTKLGQRPGFAQLAAAREGRVFAVWHLFYSHSYNIVGLEWLAKFAYPQPFAALDPADTYKAIITRFTDLPNEPFIQAARMPVQQN